MNNFAEDSMKLHNRNLQGMYLSNLVANPRVHYTVDLQTSAQQMLGANSCSNAFSEMGQNEQFCCLQYETPQP